MVEKAKRELAEAKAEFYRSLVENIASPLVRKEIAQVGAEYALALQGITKAEWAQENHDYVQASVHEAFRFLRSHIGTPGG